MRIKKYINRWFAALFMAGLSVMSLGCKKYLDQLPADSLTREQFFKTEADANASIAGVYDALQTSVTQFLIWGEFRADLITPVTNTANTYSYYEYFSPDATSTLNSTASDWTVAYRLIGRANIVIESVPGIVQTDPNFTQAKSDAIVGEARFLRALSYFYLVRTFKEVPLVLTASSNDDVAFKIPKSPADSILNQIERDLAFAEAGVPVSFRDNITTKGRATKAAVNALQTDVYLWRAKYQQAADASKKVLANTSYTLVSGANWFSQFAQKNSTESIFEVQFNYQTSETNSLGGLSNAFTVNDALYNYYVIEQDNIRGANNTYVSIGSRVFFKYTGLAVVGNLAVGRPTNDANFIVYRLADVMLLRAEALSHLGFNERQEAVDLINQIRARAGITQYTTVDGSASTALLESYIFKERAMELAMEGKRWFDLVRLATNENNPDLLISTVLAGRSVTERAVIRSRIIDPRAWYLPILSTELTKNSLLVQNPYYQ
jgi:hypothetical protein